MIHQQKVAYVESAPCDWPDGWSFGPGKPTPPGWSSRDYPETVLAAGVSGADPLELEVYALDRYSEDTDVLAGQILIIKAYNCTKRVRMRLDSSAPYSEELWLKMDEYEPGKFGIRRKIFVDRARCASDAIHLVATVYASQLDVEVDA